MWSKIPSYETTRPIYSTSSSFRNCGSSIYSTRSDNDAEYKQNLKDIRRMGIKLVHSNRKISDKISKNTRTARRQRYFENVKPILKPNKSAYRPSYDFLGQSSVFSSCSSNRDGQRIYGGSFDIPRNLYDESSESPYTSSSGFLGQSFISQSPEESYLSQSSHDTWFSTLTNGYPSLNSSDSLPECLDDDISFEILGSARNDDVYALTDMLNNIFGYNKIYQKPKRKSSSTSPPHKTNENREFKNSELYDTQFNANARSSTDKDARFSASNLIRESKCSREPSELVSMHAATERRDSDRKSSFEKRPSIPSRRDSKRVDLDKLGKQPSIPSRRESKRIDQLEVVGVILAGVITDVENSMERLDWN